MSSNQTTNKEQRKKKCVCGRDVLLTLCKHTPLFPLHAELGPASDLEKALRMEQIKDSYLA